MRVSERQWIICPCCGQRTSKRHLERHVRLCRMLTERYGSPADLAAMFRANPRIKIKHIIADNPEIGIRFVRGRLLYGGLKPEEMAGRIGHYARPKGAEVCCRRCGVCLHHPRVLDMMAGDAALQRLHETAAALDTPLCAWCATEITQMDVEERAQDRPRWEEWTMSGRHRSGGSNKTATH